MGDGAMRNTKVIPNKEIEQIIVFNTPLGDSESDVYWKFEEGEAAGTTDVTWGMKGEQSFLEKVFMSFQSEDFETTLRIHHQRRRCYPIWRRILYVQYHFSKTKRYWHEDGRYDGPSNGFYAGQ